MSICLCCRMTVRICVSLIKVESCGVLLRMLSVYIGGFQKSVLRCKFLILNIYHLDALYLGQKGCKDSWLYFEAKRESACKIGWKTLGEILAF